MYLHPFVSIEDLKEWIRINYLNVYKNSDHLDAVMKNIKEWVIKCSLCNSGMFEHLLE